jgi:hypothetical protein
MKRRKREDEVHLVNVIAGIWLGIGLLLCLAKTEERNPHDFGNVMASAALIVPPLVILISYGIAEHRERNGTQLHRQHLQAQLRRDEELGTKREREQQERAARRAKWAVEREAFRAERAAKQAARRAERDKAYRAKGVEPGPLAWFKVLPDLIQAIVLGLLLAIPSAAILIASIRLFNR